MGSNGKSFTEFNAMASMKLLQSYLLVNIHEDVFISDNWKANSFVV